MRVLFVKNLGSNDALPLDLDFRRCQEGREIEVSENVGLSLVRRRLADEVVDIRAVPSIQIKAEPQPEAVSVAVPVIETKQEQPVEPAPQPVTHSKKNKEK